MSHCDLPGSGAIRAHLQRRIGVPGAVPGALQTAVDRNLANVNPDYLPREACAVKPPGPWVLGPSWPGLRYPAPGPGDLQSSSTELSRLPTRLHFTANPYPHRREIRGEDGEPHSTRWRPSVPMISMPPASSPEPILHRNTVLQYSAW
jgi:hypothetical protein